VSIAPPQPIASVAARARIAASIARLSADRGERARALRRALTGTLLGRAGAAERQWIVCIERRRSELLADRALTGPSFHPAPREVPGGATLEREVPVAVASEMMSLAPLWCLMLMRLIRELQPRSCLELGTGFGISTGYQAAALRLNGRGRLTTIEGSRAWSERARANLAALGLKGVEFRVGPIGETLAEEAAAAAPLDFVFIDAEHQAGATIAYFEALLPSLADGALVVLDDIHWPEMRRAQAEIARRERVGSSIAVGRMGLTAIAAG
jgi:predicted O-methyltransferase YrrM